MSDRVRVDQMADEIMKGLMEYAGLATDEMKAAVKDAGKYAKEEISATAPKDTGKYAKSWTSKVTAESAYGIQVTVHSPKKYQLAHLLEHGHAKRGGGRTAAQPHIAPAEEKAERKLEEDIKRALEG